MTYSDGSTVNLTGASVNFVMRALASNLPTTNAAATIVNATSPAQVSYTPTAADTATAGEYMGNWVVTYAGGAIETFPTVGYLSITVEENLTTPGGAQLVSLADVKEYLNLDPADRVHDAALTFLINSATPIIENIVGTVVPKQYDEWYDGGQTFIRLRHRPVMSVQAATEYRGPIAYDLLSVQDPAHGSIYSYMFDGDRLVRRSPGGSIIATPYMPQSVHVIYTAGRQPIPWNIRHGTLELLRINWQETQEISPSPGMGTEDLTSGGPALGYYVPNRVKEILAPSKRAPSVA